jgi:hypothetical protein
MALHARSKGFHVDLIYFSCCAWLLIEDLPKLSLSTSSPSELPPLHKFFFNIHNRRCAQTLLHCIVQKSSFPTSLCFPKSDSEQESYICITPTMKSVLISESTTLNVFAITPCTGLQICWFLMHWNGNMMGLLNISFSSFVHIWAISQIDEDNNIHHEIWRGWWFVLQLFGNDFSLHHSSLDYMFSENQAFSLHVLF